MMTPQRTPQDFKTEAPSVLKLCPLTEAELLTACVAGLQLLSLRSRGAQLAEFKPSTLNAFKRALTLNSAA
jgi:hypothetical protein